MTASVAPTSRRREFGLALFIGASAACGGGARDVVPETHDVHIGAAGSAGGTYSYVARRPLGFIAVSRESGLGAELGARAADHLADALDACATDLATKGKLVEGTIRVEASVATDGSIVVSHMTVAPGDAVAANALLCVVAPMKLTSFPPDPGDAGARAFGFDASWGPQQGRGVGGG